jgi:hypothetical protein
MTVYHERASDRAREREVADALARAWSCELVAEPPRSRFDFTAYRDGEPVGVIEVKCRFNRGPYDNGGTLLMNDDKRAALLEAANGDRAAIFVVCFPPVAHWLDVRELPPSARLEVLGRPDWRDTRGARPTWRIRVADTRRLFVWEDT